MTYRADKADSDIDTLKAWCHWRRLELEKAGPGQVESVLESEWDFLKALENVVSQVGTWKAKFDRAYAELKTYWGEHSQFCSNQSGPASKCCMPLRPLPLNAPTVAKGDE